MSRVAVCSRRRRITTETEGLISTVVHCRGLLLHRDIAVQGLLSPFFGAQQALRHGLCDIAPGGSCSRRARAPGRPGPGPDSLTRLSITSLSGTLGSRPTLMSLGSTSRPPRCVATIRRGLRTRLWVVSLTRSGAGPVALEHEHDIAPSAPLAQHVGDTPLGAALSVS